jgi:hypothetical protein
MGRVDISLAVEKIVEKLEQALDQCAVALAELLHGEKAQALVAIPVERPIRIPRRRRSIRTR